MIRSRFVEMFDRQTRSISSEVEQDGSLSLLPPNYDVDDFKSFLTTFRQVFVSKNEPVYFFRITQVIKKYASPEFQHYMAVVEEALRPILEGKHHYKHRLVWESAAGERSLTSAQILDALINGKVFHADRKHRRAVKLLDGLEPCFWLWPIMGDIIKPAFYGCMFIYCQLMRDSILHKIDYPEGCLMPGQAVDHDQGYS